MLIAEAAGGVYPLLLIGAAAIAIPVLDRRRQRIEAEYQAAYEAACDLSHEEHVGTPVGEEWAPPAVPICIRCNQAIPLPGRHSCYACGIAALKKIQGGTLRLQTTAPLDQCIVCRTRPASPDRHVCEQCSIMAVARSQGVQP